MDGPRFAARIVSLIPFYRGVELIGGNLSAWNASFSTMVKLQGDIEDHAILLCSMLLGTYCFLTTYYSSDNNTSTILKSYATKCAKSPTNKTADTYRLGTRCLCCLWHDISSQRNGRKLR